MLGSVATSDLRSVITEAIAVMVDALSPDLDILTASEGWAAMLRGREMPPLKEQLGYDLFSDLQAWLKNFVEGPKCNFGVAAGFSGKTARYRKMMGKEADGTWFRSVLTVRVVELSEDTLRGMAPVVLSLERKKLKRTPPRHLDAPRSKALSAISEEGEEQAEAELTKQDTALDIAPSSLRSHPCDPALEVSSIPCSMCYSIEGFLVDRPHGLRRTVISL